MNSVSQARFKNPLPDQSNLPCISLLQFAQLLTGKANHICCHLPGALGELKGERSLASPPQAGECSAQVKGSDSMRAFFPCCNFSPVDP